MYTIKLNDAVIASNVSQDKASLLVDKFKSELESRGVNIVDEIWDQQLYTIDLVSTKILDDNVTI